MSSDLHSDTASEISTTGSEQPEPDALETPVDAQADASRSTERPLSTSISSLDGSLERSLERSACKSPAASPAVSPATSPARLHLTHIEGIRAIAALVVYVNHAYAQAWNPMQGQFPQGALSLFSYSLIAGHFAVTVFIAVSGFCLALPVMDAGDRLRGGTTEFLKRRAWRILPPYYAALALSLVLIWTVIGEPTGSLWDVPIAVDAQAIASHLLLLQDFFRTGRINYVFWSIAVEWHIYFVFPLLVLATRRLGLLRVVFLSLIFGCAISVASADMRLHRANPHYLGIFALGVLAAYLSRGPGCLTDRLLDGCSLGTGFRGDRKLSTRFWSRLTCCLLLGACALIAWLGYDLSHRQIVGADLIVGLFACSLLVQTTRSKFARGTLLCRALEWKPLVFLGTFSYSLYLVHAPFLQLIWQHLLLPFELSREATFYFLMSGGLGLVLLGAYAFFLLCERPFLRRRAAAPSWWPFANQSAAP